MNPKSTTPKPGNRNGAPSPDRLPPHAPEAEQGILGCILLSPTQSLLHCQEEGVRPEWFYDLRHQVIYHNLERLFSVLPPETPIDLIMLHQRLSETGALEQTGGLSYLNELQDAVPSAANVSYYADIVREKWLLRRVDAAFVEGSMKIAAREGTVDAVLADAHRLINELTESSVPRVAQPVRAFLPAVIDNIEDYHRGHAQIRGLPTGIEYVDKMLCGIGQQNGNMFVLAARPGTGKTAFALDVAAHVALDAVWFEPLYDETGVRARDAEGMMKSARRVTAPVAFFSMEMKAEALVDRLVWQRARADKQRWRTGFATDADLAPLVKASEEIGKAKIFVDDSPRLAVEELCARARQLHRQHGIRLFIVDYFQLLHARKEYRNDRVQELAYVSALLYATSKMLNVPFLVLAQMNRDYEKEVTRKPRLSDLKDCGAIEQDADVVGFLYEPTLKGEKETQWEERLLAAYPNKAKNDVDWSRAPRRINLNLAKNRYGPMGDCGMLFHKSCTHFEDLHQWEVKNGFVSASAGEKQPELDNKIDPEDVP